MFLFIFENLEPLIYVWHIVSISESVECNLLYEKEFECRRHWGFYLEDPFELMKSKLPPTVEISVHFDHNQWDIWSVILNNFF